MTMDLYGHLINRNFVGGSPEGRGRGGISDDPSKGKAPDSGEKGA